MGYTRHGRQDGVERFMRHYFLTARDVARLSRVLEPALVRAARGSPAVVAAERMTRCARPASCWRMGKLRLRGYRCDRETTR